MIRVNTLDEIVQFNMGREVDGKVLYWVSAYLVDGLLIDTGCHYTAEELTDILQNYPLAKVVNTHYHEDHIGGNRLIKEKLGVDIWAHPASIPLIRKKPFLYSYQEMVWGYPEITEVKPLVGDEIKTGRYNFKVIETPGHCPDHISLAEPSRGWCFSGDLFVSEKPRFIRREEDTGKIVESMQKLINLPFEISLYTAMGRVVWDGKRALRECVAYLTQLSRQAGKLRQQGLSPPHIRDALLGRESTMAQLTDGEFSSENLIKSLLEAEL